MMSSSYGTPGDHAKVFGIGVVWIDAAIVAIGAISIGLWAFGVFTSDIKGAGGAIKQSNSTVNRVQKQEMFEQLVADYDGYVVKIGQLALIVATTSDATDKDLRTTELLGMTQVCVDVAQQFNAESRKYTSRDWKSAGLPPSLDSKGCTP
jgi:hypothetical protein